MDHKFVHNLNNCSQTLNGLHLIDPFRQAMQHPVIRNSYKPLKNFIDYDAILEKALLSTVIFELPEYYYGKTLVSAQIVLGNFKNYNKNQELLHGGLLYEFIHEFAHFLQRCELRTLEDVEAYTTPEILGKEGKETGEWIEEVLFGMPNNLFLPGAKFLLSLPACSSPEDLCEQFKKANVRHQEHLTLRSMNSDGDEMLELKGMCGLKMRKMLKNHQI